MSKHRIDTALERFRAGERDLYTDEGQKLYSDEEHERRHDALSKLSDDRARLSIVCWVGLTVRRPRGLAMHSGSTPNTIAYKIGSPRRIALGLSGK
jgi:hypothetical protein